MWTRRQPDPVGLKETITEFIDSVSGKLRAEVRDADSSLIGDGPVVEDMGQGKYRVRFNPDQPGKYSIYLYWNELPVESAFPVRARSSAEDLPTTSRAVREPIPQPVYSTSHTR